MTKFELDPFDLGVLNHFNNVLKINECPFLFIYMIINNLGLVNPPEAPFLWHISPRLLADIYAHIHQILWEKEKKVNFVVKKRKNCDTSIILSRDCMRKAVDFFEYHVQACLNLCAKSEYEHFSWYKYYDYFTKSRRDPVETKERLKMFNHIIRCL